MGARRMPQVGQKGIIEMNRVIITGPTGAIGMALLRYLEERGIQVIAVVREDSDRKSQIQESEQVMKVECGLNGLQKLPEIIRAAAEERKWDTGRMGDVFYHFAWEGAFGDGRNDISLQIRNISCALKAVEAADKLGCSAFIGAGSQAEFGRYEGKLNASVPAFPENGYGIAKLCAGQMTRILCGQKGIRHIWTRILSVYGPYDRDITMIMNTIGRMLRGERASCTKGEQIWDYLYAGDAAKMMYLLGEKGIHGKTYCLGSGDARPLKEYIEMIREEIGPDAEAGYGDIAYADGQVMHLCADIRELIEDTGYTPDYTFETGIRETIAWYRRSRMKQGETDASQFPEGRSRRKG